MSTEARAPGDVEETVAWLEEEAGIWYRQHDESRGDKADRAAATLRDLSRKLEEAEAETERWADRTAEAIQQLVERDAALEDARREAEALVAFLSEECRAEVIAGVERTAGLAAIGIIRRQRVEMEEMRKALRYARRFLNAGDHDLAYIDRALSPQPQERPERVRAGRCEWCNAEEVRPRLRYRGLAVCRPCYDHETAADGQPQEPATEGEEGTDG